MENKIKWVDVFNEAVKNKELEITLPEYLYEDLYALCQGYDENSMLLWNLWNLAQSSINIAYYDGVISEADASYLRKKYMFKDEND